MQSSGGPPFPGQSVTQRPLPPLDPGVQTATMQRAVPRAMDPQHQAQQMAQHMAAHPQAPLQQQYPSHHSLDHQQMAHMPPHMADPALEEEEDSMLDNVIVPAIGSVSLARVSMWCKR